MAAKEGAAVQKLPRLQQFVLSLLRPVCLGAIGDRTHTANRYPDL